MGTNGARQIQTIQASGHGHVVQAVWIGTTMSAGKGHPILVDETLIHQMLECQAFAETLEDNAGTFLG
jgi:hypothetical protein